ncbi:MAG TPA: PEP-CTERM sorting domain-containing protein [Candidatus Acidoferrales bacterium]|nr:PEP-CTERM sorting domain-containing protein [Candidatus Acidoferrales bacterium]
MNAKKLLVGAFLVLAAAGTALASSAPVDPSIILRDPPPTSCSSEGVICVDANNFGFNVDPSGGGVFDFFNDLGVTITNLTFILHSQGGPVNCVAQEYFENCSETALSGDLIQVVFSGIGDEGCLGDSDENSDQVGGDPDAANTGHNECNGILSGTTFTLDLFNQGPSGDLGSGGWVDNSSVVGIANSPEPGSLLLLLTAVPFVIWRKRQ